MDSLPEWLSRNELYFNPSIDTTNQDSNEPHQQLDLERRRVNNLEDANLIGSRWSQHPHELHKLFLDIDVPHLYNKSKRPGHAHLILNVNLTRPELVVVNDMFVALGITGKGNYEQVIKNEQNYLRTKLPRTPLTQY